MRILLITENTAYLEVGSPERNMLEMHATIARETHMIVLTKKGTAMLRTQIAPNVQLYTTDSSFGVLQVSDTCRIAQGLPTVDLVVCEEPLRAGRAGVRIARKRKISLQVHVDSALIKSESGHATFLQKFQMFRVKNMLRAADCYRVSDIGTKDALIQLGLLRGKQISIVPSYIPVEEDAGAMEATANAAMHPELHFKIFTHVTTETVFRPNGPFKVFHELSTLYPWVGMVVVGTPEAIARAKKEAHAQGVGDRVFYRSTSTELVQALTSSQMVLVTDPDTLDSSLLHDAAHHTVAMVLPEEAHDGVLVHEEHCLTCPADDVECFVQQIRRLIEDNGLRSKLRIAAKMVFTETIVPPEEHSKLLAKSYMTCITKELS